MTTEIGSNTALNDNSANWMRQIRQQARKCDEENGVLRNLYKRAKSDGQNVASMRAAIKLTKLEPDVVQSDLRDQIRYMAILKIPMTPAGLFDWDAEVAEITQVADDMWIAGDKGYAAGRLGSPVDSCPYEPGDEMHVHWLASWKQGQAAIAREMGPDFKLADASRKRPARGAAQEELTPTTLHAVEPKKRGRPKGATRANGQLKANGEAATAH